MSELLIGIGALVALGCALSMLAAGVCRPYLLVLCYLFPFLFFSMSTFGSLEGGTTFWGRGSGKLYLPIIVWILIGTYCLTWFSDQFNGRRVQSTPLHIWFYAWTALLIAHLVAAMVVGESVTTAGHHHGFRELVVAGVFFALLLRAFHDAKSIGILVRFFVTCVIVRGLYGLGRFVFFGGDPSNVYANMDKIDVKLTFFDINDGLLATIVIFIAAWQLSMHWRALSNWTRTLLIATFIVELGIVIFSYRRTAWGGLVLACLLFVVLLPRRRRLIAALVGIPVTVSGVAYAAANRLDVFQRGIWKGIFPDLGGTSIIGGVSQREYELRLAWQAFLDNPVFGVGSWGSYHGGVADISWHQGPHAFGYVHSGILHVLFKTGLVGFTLFVGLCVAFLTYVARNRESVLPGWRGLYYAGVAGFLFLVPIWMFGTPVGEYRTMQLFAFCLALPVLALRASTRLGESR